MLLKFPEQYQNTELLFYDTYFNNVTCYALIARGCKYVKYCSK